MWFTFEWRIYNDNNENILRNSGLRKAETFDPIIRSKWDGDVSKLHFPHTFEIFIFIWIVVFSDGDTIYKSLHQKRGSSGISIAMKAKEASVKFSAYCSMMLGKLLVFTLQI